MKNKMKVLKINFFSQIKLHQKNNKKKIMYSIKF